MPIDPTLLAWSSARRLGIKSADLTRPERLHAALAAVRPAKKALHPEDLARVRSYLDHYVPDAAQALHGQLTGHPFSNTHVGGAGRLAADADGTELSLTGSSLELSVPGRLIQLTLTPDQEDHLRPLLEPHWAGVPYAFDEKLNVCGPPPVAAEGRMALKQGFLTLSADKTQRSRLRVLTPLDGAGPILHELTLKWGDWQERKEVTVALHPDQFNALFPLTKRIQERERRTYRFEGHRVNVDTFPEGVGRSIAEVGFPSRQEAARFIDGLTEDSWLRPVRQGWSRPV